MIATPCKKDSISSFGHCTTMCTQVTSHFNPATVLHVRLQMRHFNFPLLEITGWGTSLCILECLVKPPANLHIKLHVGKVCFVGFPDRAASLTASFDLWPCNFWWSSKLAFDRRKRLHTLHLSSCRKSVAIPLSSCIWSAPFNTACSTCFCSKISHLSLMSSFQDARFSINAS